MFKKATYLFICALLLSTYCFSQNTSIPDDNFEQALIDLGLDVGPLNNLVPTANIVGITDLNIVGRNILDLTGIEGFANLSILECSNNLLTSIDVSNNLNLTQLFVDGNNLSNLNIINNTALQILWCFNNQLTSLNVNSNLNLISLRCERNQLTNLNISNNTKLNVLVCEENEITTLDVSNNTSLNRLQCGNNLLINLDISANSDLNLLSCEENLLTELNLFSNNNLVDLTCYTNQLTQLDLSLNSNLISLECYDNELCSLNLKNGNNSNITLMNFNDNPDLNCVVVDNFNADHSFWEPISFVNYVNSTSDCNTVVPVDSINDFIGISYTLPAITNGNYYTESGGLGILLNSGDVITSSQTIYIYNEINCNSNESSFNVIINNEDYFIPKYFTPNNDGSNDVWQIYDRMNLVNNISIYNRYGQLIKFLPGSAFSWDGTFNGKLLENDSYWYEIVLNSREIIRGYFALKR
ncbi:T9SS type B sorting domain-containing protein [Seonamhaeicola sp. MEBiC1930]|uniref:T9SS type B sorting domain-containing protein n=1 Tax=Seonamhaeicola sp. MEBiC01930 TaxID=2976768 RepID=UPI00324A534D